MTMSSPNGADGAQPAADRFVLDAERQLFLVDRIIGLEAELARIKDERETYDDRVEAAEAELVKLTSSYTWRAGRKVTGGARWLRRVVSRKPRA